MGAIRIFHYKLHRQFPQLSTFCLEKVNNGYVCSPISITYHQNSCKMTVLLDLWHLISERKINK